MIIDTNSHIKIYNKEAVMLDFRINTFLTVCEYMNFTAASEKLNLSQPAVSQHIKYLEDCYNTKLFYRDKKNIHLTSSGEILFSAFKTVSNDEIKLKNMLNESKKQIYKAKRTSKPERRIVDGLEKKWIFHDKINDKN